MTPTTALLAGLTSADYDVYRQTLNQVVGLGSRAALPLVEQALARRAGRPTLCFHRPGGFLVRSSGAGELVGSDLYPAPKLTANCAKEMICVPW